MIRKIESSLNFGYNYFQIELAENNKYLYAYWFRRYNIVILIYKTGIFITEIECWIKKEYGWEFIPRCIPWTLGILQYFKMNPTEGYLVGIHSYPEDYFKVSHEIISQDMNLPLLSSINAVYKGPLPIHAYEEQIIISFKDKQLMYGLMNLSVVIHNERVCRLSSAARWIWCIPLQTKYIRIQSNKNEYLPVVRCINNTMSPADHPKYYPMVVWACKKNACECNGLGWVGKCEICGEVLHVTNIFKANQAKKTKKRQLNQLYWRFQFRPLPLADQELQNVLEIYSLRATPLKEMVSPPSRCPQIDQT